LRSDGAVVVALVAVENDEIVGHILFSDLLIEAEQAVLHAVSLAPMAVLPDHQRRGIGSALVRQGLAICRERGKSIVVVLGHPAYYPRFGFSAELAQNLLLTRDSARNMTIFQQDVQHQPLTDSINGYRISGMQGRYSGFRCEKRLYRADIMVRGVKSDVRLT